MEIVIVCLVACVICVAAVLVTNHTATQKGYTKGVQDGIQQRKQQAEAEIGSAEKEAARVIHDAKKEAEQQKKSVLLSYYTISFNCLMWKLVNYSIFHAVPFSIDGQALLNG